MDQRAFGVEVPCCTDRLSLMAGTYGNVVLSPVPSGNRFGQLVVREVYNPDVVAEA